MNNGLRSDYITKIANLCLTNNLYVLPCDFFYKLNRIKLNDSYILNLDHSSEKGSHYVGLFLSKQGVLFFDPLGLPIINTYIRNGLLKHDVTEITYSKKIIQGGLSFHCGIFVIAFHIVCALKEKSLDEFLSLFSENDFTLNEKIATFIITEQLQKLH